MYRKIDKLGRIVLPKEIRNSLSIATDDVFEITVDSDNILLKKNKNSCSFCRNTDSIIKFKDKNICEKCLQELKTYIKI